MNKYYSIVVVLIILLFFVASCTNNVTRIEPKEEVDLSGEWNDHDSRLISVEMINDALTKPWISKFERSQHRAPVVIVGGIRNLSYEHINVNTFIADMEREFINSGKVEFVASNTERKDIRDERRDQDLHASEETRKVMGNEIGADFMLKGQLNMIVDVNGDKKTKFYQVDLTLISLLDNKKVWVGQKKIKKYILNK